jgi:hypothetical protein
MVMCSCLSLGCGASMREEHALVHACGCACACVATLQLGDGHQKLHASVPSLTTTGQLAREETRIE